MGGLQLTQVDPDTEPPPLALTSSTPQPGAPDEDREEGPEMELCCVKLTGALPEEPRADGGWWGGRGFRLWVQVTLKPSWVQDVGHKEPSSAR